MQSLQVVYSIARGAVRSHISADLINGKIQYD